jgi:dolichol-phosphate mannosyltransferase
MFNLDNQKPDAKNPVMNAAKLTRLAKRFIRFGLVGGSGVFVDMAAFFVMTDPRVLGWDISLSKCLAAEVAIVNNFTWNDVWTFRDIALDETALHFRARRFVKFNFICLAGIGISLLLLNVQVRMFHVNIYVANFMAIFVASLWNFWMNLKFGWQKAKPKPDEKILSPFQKTG